MTGTIVVNADSIRIFCIMLLGAVWVYLLSHPGEDDE